MPEDFIQAPKPDFALAGKLIGALKKKHWDDAPERKGMHAYGYTRAEQEAIDIVVAEGMKLGIPVTTLAGRLDATPTLFPTGDAAKALIGFLVEAHIEQGNYCAKQDVNIGIVKAIRGNTRFLDAKITGEAAHSGATFEEDRADANRTYVKLMHAAEEWFDVQRRYGRDVVFTPGKGKSNNESATTVSDNITFSFEIRSSDEKVLRDFADFMKDKAAEIVSSHPNNKLKIELPPANIAKPAEMDKAVIEHAQAIAGGLGIRSGIVTSGAGHDTVQFANTGTPSVMLFIKQDDPISHNPRESRREDSFKNACRIIAGMIMNPLEKTQETTLPPDGPKSFREYIMQQGATPYTPQTER